MRTAIPASTGAIIAVIGVVMLTQCYFIITISHNSDLWKQVLQTTQFSSLTLIFSYVQFIIGASFVGGGILVAIISDNKAELPTQKINPKYLKNEWNHIEKTTSLYTRLVWIFISLEFISSIILCLIGLKVISESLFDTPLAISVFLFLGLTLLFNSIEKRKKLMPI